MEESRGGTSQFLKAIYLGVDRGYVVGDSADLYPVNTLFDAGPEGRKISPLGAWPKPSVR